MSAATILNSNKMSSRVDIIHHLTTKSTEARLDFEKHKLLVSDTSITLAYLRDVDVATSVATKRGRKIDRWWLKNPQNKPNLSLCYADAIFSVAIKCNVTRIFIHGHKLDADIMWFIANRLNHCNSSVEDISLENCDIDNTSLARFNAELCLNFMIKRFSIHGNQVGANHRPFCQFSGLLAKMPNLEHFDCSDNDIRLDSQDGRDLEKCLQDLLPKLRHFDLKLTTKLRKDF